MLNEKLFFKGKIENKIFFDCLKLLGGEINISLNNLIFASKNLIIQGGKNEIDKRKKQVKIFKN